MTPELQLLAELGTKATQEAILEYTNWCVISASIWMIVGVGLACVAIHLRKYVASLAIALVAMLFIACNLPTLISPRAYAIHQLLKDVRGGSF